MFSKKIRKNNANTPITDFRDLPLNNKEKPDQLNIYAGILSEDTYIQIGKIVFPVMKNFKIYGDKSGNIIGENLMDGRGFKTFADLEITLGPNNIKIPCGSYIFLHDESPEIEAIEINQNLLLKVGCYEILFSRKRSFGDSAKIRFHKNGNVARGYLAEDTTLRIGELDIPLRALSDLEFSEDGSIVTKSTFGSASLCGVYLAADLRYPIKSGTAFLRKDSLLGLYENQNILCANLKEELVVTLGENTIIFKPFYTEPERGILNNDIFFLDNGTPCRGYLKNDSWLVTGQNKLEFKKDMPIGVYKNGFVVFGNLVNDSVIKTGAYEILFEATSEPINFHENGNVLKGNLVHNTTLAINGQPVTFKSKGEERTVLYDPYLYFYDVTFYETGTLKSGTLAEDTSIKVGEYDISFKANSSIYFNETGKVNSGYPAEKTKIGPHFYDSDRIINFDTNGNPVMEN